MKRYDHRFRVGWLSDEVIDSFLWNLGLYDSTVLVIPTTVMLMLQTDRDGSVDRLWSFEDITNKEWLMGPWNPSGSHWILVAYHFPTKQLIVIDPMHNIASPITTSNAITIFAKILHVKFNISNVVIGHVNHTLQDDSLSCGVFTCWYAMQLLQKQSLIQEISVDRFRYNIFETIVGNCMHYVTSSNSEKLCGSCEGSDNEDEQWIECNRCEQWYHCSCVGITLDELPTIMFFFCPH